MISTSKPCHWPPYSFLSLTELANPWVFLLFLCNPILVTQAWWFADSARVSSSWVLRTKHWIEAVRMLSQNDFCICVRSLIVIDELFWRKRTHERRVTIIYRRWQGTSRILFHRQVLCIVISSNPGAMATGWLWQFLFECRLTILATQLPATQLLPVRLNSRVPVGWTQSERQSSPRIFWGYGFLCGAGYL